MNELIGRTPFFRLLLPVAGAILLSPILSDNRLLPVIFMLAGLSLIVLSYCRDESHHFRDRWLFGAGSSLFLFALTLLQCHEQSLQREYNFPDRPCSYLAIVQDIPEEKARSVQCPVHTVYPIEKKLMLYLEKSSAAAQLLPGEEILFTAKPQPFQNFGNPGEWDYAGYMHNRGFAARDFIGKDEWQVTGRKSVTPHLLAQRCRIKVLRFYRSLGLEEDTFSFIAAVTLGYKAYLSDDIEEAFRASGTAHLLAVSGLHTGVIYMILSLLLIPLGNSGRGLIIRQGLIILMLWGYAFLAGLSPSVVRAVIMLSLYCMGQLRRMRGFTTNSLAAAAFLILFFQPYSLYDISFQLSFGAVFSILWFQPRLISLIKPKKKIVAYLWKLMTLSLSAQLGLFPIVLHHFGTFPTWFFLSNIMLIPLMGGIIYSLIPLLITGWLHTILNGIPELVLLLPRHLVQLLTTAMLHTVQFMESLPLAELTGLHISLPATIMLLLFIFPFSLFLRKKQPRTLILALSSLLSFQLLLLQEQLHTEPPQMVVMNKRPNSEISLYVEGKYQPIMVPENGIVPHPQKIILRLSDGSFNHFSGNSRFPVDILILSHHCCFDMEQLCRLFQPSMIVIDSSLPRLTAASVAAECRIRGIPLHDVQQKGAFSLNF